MRIQRHATCKGAGTLPMRGPYGLVCGGCLNSIGLGRGNKVLWHVDYRYPLPCGPYLLNAFLKGYEQSKSAVIRGRSIIEDEDFHREPPDWVQYYHLMRTPDRGSKYPWPGEETPAWA